MIDDDVIKQSFTMALSGSALLRAPKWFSILVHNWDTDKWKWQDGEKTAVTLLNGLLWFQTMLFDSEKLCGHLPTPTADQ